MPRTTRSILLVPLVAAALFGAAGCSSIIPGVAAPAGSGPAPAGSGGTAPTTTDDPVAWVDQVCGALIPFAEAASQAPPLDSSNPDQLVSGLSSFLGTVGEAAGTAAAGVQAAGPSPIEGGDQLATDLTTTLTSIQTSFNNVKQTLDTSGSSDPNALLEAVAPLEELSTNDPTAAIYSNPELNAAAEQAANCNQLQTLGPS